MLLRPSCGRDRTYSSPERPPSEGSTVAGEQWSSPWLKLVFLAKTVTTASSFVCFFEVDSVLGVVDIGLAGLFSDPPRRRGSGGGGDEELSSAGTADEFGG